MDGLKGVFDKISSYNIFNYLLPGILFIYLTGEISGYNLIQDNNFVGAFLYYFSGMVVSRFGSLVIEPFLKWIKFVKFKDYKLFVNASRIDSKIALLSEVNNTYRTILSMLVLFCLQYPYLIAKDFFLISHTTTVILVIVFISILFLFSYRKQTAYISKRIETNTNK
jgi:hypothetical protein